jgi:hypothetical protein
MSDAPKEEQPRPRPRPKESGLRKFGRRAFWSGFVGVATPLAASMVYAIYKYNTTPEDQISELHTPRSIWVQSTTNYIMSNILGKPSMLRLQQNCANAAKVNEELLLSLIKRHKDTAYGKDHNLGDIKSRKDFQKMHPITDHDHYDSYIQRMVDDGETNVMFPDGEALRMIAETSGTSGTRKLLPVTKMQRQIFFTRGIGVTFHALQNRQTDPNDSLHQLNIQWPNLQKSCKLWSQPKYGASKHGVPTGPNSSAPSDNRTLLQLYTTPEAALKVQTENEIQFLHAVFALLDKNLGFIESNFANRVFNFFVLMDERWDELIECIRTGELPETLDIDTFDRVQINRSLRANPQRAEELQRIKLEHTLSTTKHVTESENTASFARKVWPKLHTILAAETGAFQIYGEKLRREWIGNDITIYSPLYAATEGLIGVNPNVMGKTYVLHPGAMFFEFLPVDDDNQHERNNNACLGEGADGHHERNNNNEMLPETIFIEQLQRSKEYELIITNLTGLYRYRLGDVVRCVGYRGESPIVEFAYRKGQFLNVCGERTSEETLYKALAKTAEEDWNLSLKDYTTVEYFATADRGKPRYTLYVELADSSIRPGPLTTQQCNAFDRNLCQSNWGYKVLRSRRKLQNAHVIAVNPGTFAALREEMIHMGMGASQLKQPRVTRAPSLIKLLEDNSVI